MSYRSCSLTIDLYTSIQFKYTLSLFLNTDLPECKQDARQLLLIVFQATIINEVFNEVHVN